MLSTKPYLIRALWTWCCDAGFTPYLTIVVDEQCDVPREYSQDGTLTLNLSPMATGALDIANDWISLSARFGGVSRQIFIPVGAVIGIFARENGVGMEFSYEPTLLPTDAGLAPGKTDAPGDVQSPGRGHLVHPATSKDDAHKPVATENKPGRPVLHRIK